MVSCVEEWESRVRIAVTRYVFAAPGRIWEVLVDWERQPQWMLDARDVRVLSEIRRGEGVRLECPTNVLGFTVRDVMRVTSWQPPRRLGVSHEGRLITGDGAFDLESTAVGTRVTWTEHVLAPLGRVGELGARVVVRPLIHRLFASSLTRFKRLCEDEAGRLKATSNHVDEPGHP